MTLVIRWDWLKSPGPTTARSYLAIFLGCVCVKELSVFIDESGVFGPYEAHSPFYIVAMVFHDQSSAITENIDRLNARISLFGLPNYTIHAGPLIRREYEYSHMSLLDRKRIFNFLYNFVRTSDIEYYSITIEKKHLVEDIDLHFRLAKQLSTFLFKHIDRFALYDRIVVYYDYGQMELTKILVSVFTTIIHNIEFRRISPADYKLFQAADMLCTLELLEAKAIRKMLSKSELTFFSSAKELDKSYLRAIKRKRFE